MQLTPNFTLSCGSYTVMKFPSGEIQVTLTEVPSNNYSLTIFGSILSSDHLMELLQLRATLSKEDYKSIRFIMPYCAYSRQDRVCNPGEAFSLKIFANLINSCEFSLVNTYDNHSLVSTALINNCVDAQAHEIFRRSTWLDNTTLDLEQYNYFISPDAGANKKIQACSKEFNIPMLRADKLRDTTTGRILETIIYATPAQLDNSTVLIIDDICDGGRTFIELANAIHKISPTCVVNLYITHGFFSKGVEPLLSAGINHIYTTTSVCKISHPNLTVLD